MNFSARLSSGFRLRPAALMFASVLAALLAACAGTPPPLPVVAAPAQFKEQAPAATTQAPASIAQASAANTQVPEGRWTPAPPAEAQSRGEWWRAFGDPVLDGLIAKANAQNTNLQSAAARLAEARALARESDADRAPRVGLAAGAVRDAGLDRNLSYKPSSLFTAGFVASYEVDLFGKLARTSQAAHLDAEAQAGLLQSTRLMVEADVAQAYLGLRALDAERVLVRDQVEAYRDTLRLTQSRERIGDVGELDLARVQTEVASTESEALTLDRRRAQLEHALAVLTGAAASEFDLASGDWTTALPSIPPGVPALVLARRPDVTAAQQQVLAAQARVGVAQRAWLPDISLTGGAGYASTDIGDIVKWSARSWGLGGLMSLPVFDGGRREAGVQQAQAQFDAAAAAYRAQVLVALKEVEDQLSSLRILAAQSGVQQKAVTSAERATQLSDSRYRNGMISQLDLLDARRSELTNRRQALQVRSDQYQATVALVRALGGGWDVPGVEKTAAR